MVGNSKLCTFILMVLNNIVKVFNWQFKLKWGAKSKYKEVNREFE